MLDLMASDESIADVRSALRQELEARLGDQRMREQVEELCLTAIRQIAKVVKYTPSMDLPIDEDAALPFNMELFRLIRHQPVMLLMAADRLIGLAERGRADDVFAQQVTPELIHEAALRLSGNSQALQHLGEWINQTQPKCDPSYGCKSAPCGNARLVPRAFVSPAAGRCLSRRCQMVRRKPRGNRPPISGPGCGRFLWCQLGRSRCALRVLLSCRSSGAYLTGWRRSVPT